MKKAQSLSSGALIERRRRIQQVIWAIPVKMRMRPSEVFISFITLWRIPSAGFTLTLPFVKRAVDPTADYDCQIDWGDGSDFTRISGDSWPTSAVQHVYANAGDYSVSIVGKCVGFRVINQASMRLLLLEIKQWGSIRLGNANGYFWGCENLRITATDTLVLGATNSIQNMFTRCTVLNDPITFDTTNVINMTSVFASASSFNQPVNFNTQNVTSMSSMFSNASSFNQPVNFNTQNVIDMTSMFSNATSFNQPVNFNTQKVIFMIGMFNNALAFNQPIEFQIPKVNNMTAFMSANTTFSTANYSAMLVNFSNQTLVANVRLDATGRTYFNDEITVNARNKLTGAPSNWIITDGGPSGI